MTPEAIQAARILIVDDDAAFVGTLVKFLQRKGYASLRGVSSTGEFVSAMKDFPPDIILLDWHLGELSGAEILRRLKECELELVPPVIVLTADEGDDTRQEALEAGATDFLTKPINLTEALLRIRNLLRMHFLHQHTMTEKERLEGMVQVRTAALSSTIAELKDTQHQVLAEERMRAFSAMAGGIVHDFNNALMIIRGYSELYSDDSLGQHPNEELKKGFQTIAIASRDASEIVRRLRQFYRPAEDSAEMREPVSINNLISESIELSRPKWETQSRAVGLCITVNPELEEVPMIHASPTEIREILLNLIFNAVDAMPQGGTINLRTSRTPEGIRLEVEDTGTGMTPETQQRCLEPFYSTKGARGTGLGLSIIYGIVKRHGGTVRIQSDLNHGTRITVELPKFAPIELYRSDLEFTQKSRHLRILAADDDAQVLVVLRRYLESEGHTVTVAINGCEALERFNEAPYDLVIVDQVMPKMSGAQVAKAVRDLKPEVPIILLTGFETSSVPREVDLVVNKPAALPTLRKAIAQVLLATEGEPPILSRSLEEVRRMVS